MVEFKETLLVRYVKASRPLQVLAGLNVLIILTCAVLIVVDPDNSISIDQLGEERLPEFQDLTRSVADFSAIEGKPIFHESRKPREVISQQMAAPSPAAQPQTPGQLYKLTGVMDSASGQRTAYVLSMSGQQTMKLKVGETLGDWQVKGLTRSSMTLERNGEKFELNLAR